MSSPFHPATRKGISAASGCRLPAPATLWKPRAAYSSPSLSLGYVCQQDYITVTAECQPDFTAFKAEHGWGFGSAKPYPLAPVLPRPGQVDAHRRSLRIALLQSDTHLGELQA